MVWYTAWAKSCHKNKNQPPQKRNLEENWSSYCHSTQPTIWKKDLQRKHPFSAPWLDPPYNQDNSDDTFSSTMVKFQVSPLPSLWYNLTSSFTDPDNGNDLECEELKPNTRVSKISMFLPYPTTLEKNYFDIFFLCYKIFNKSKQWRLSNWNINLEECETIFSLPFFIVFFYTMQTTLSIIIFTYTNNGASWFYIIFYFINNQ